MSAHNHAFREVLAKTPESTLFRRRSKPLQSVELLPYRIILEVLYTIIQPHSLPAPN